MKVAELSRRTGVPVPTIKYYIREGLVPRGAATSHNQAEYDEQHVQRLRLIRALIEIGGLSVAATRDILGQVDGADEGVDALLGHTMGSIVRTRQTRDDEVWKAAGSWVDEQIRRRGWRPHADYPARVALVDVVAAFHDLGQERLLEVFDVYADAAEQVAEADLEQLAWPDSLEGVVETAVVGTVLGEALFSSLRHLAHGAASGRYFPRDIGS